MSFILDALKKSELERQRQSIPGLMDSPAAAARPRFPLWAVALVALLGINLVVLVMVLTRGAAPAWLGGRAVDVPEAARHATAPAASTSASPSASTSAPPPATWSAPSSAPPSALTSGPPSTSPPAAAAPAGASPADHFSPLDAAPVYAPEIPTEDARPPAPAGDIAPRHAARTPDPVLTQDDDEPNNGVLPSISEINLAGDQALPDLHLDVHVYATKPTERFVYINMRKYREGATLAEGPRVERIRRDGVVLSYRGLRFVLPRQQ
jgi:general secretion pathway protein B